MSQSRAITRKSASNLALAFVLLPPAKREAMSALYAFCREVDDVADEEQLPPAQRRALLAEWREDLQRAGADAAPRLPVLQELQPVIHQYRLPLALFEEILRGVEMDLDIARYETYAELEVYCYRVASAVGLLSIEIFGYRNPACREYAVALGKALQFTNILRDVWVDAGRGRIYLPQEELRRHGARETDIMAGRYTPAYAAAAAAMAARARQFYQQARQLLPAEDRRAMVAAELMGSVYWCLLQRLERSRFDVFTPRLTRVPRCYKLGLILRTWARVAWGSTAPNYGRP
ncbi:presqualene diphosphate synthase HpnD [Fontisphaera persica]|uniref:presqualene diphosphate synthase HpnD n=1 Tax=Fontisphaera persica TaxID=2974023 RepID=UPI0024C0C642|nr:presqualene diphosphate synthase HpnD [Fontisphaera persica]WCJ58844.1 presqualene diphosphate synthase HpnD [Fontisphaera persica]